MCGGEYLNVDSLLSYETWNVRLCGTTSGGDGLLKHWARRNFLRPGFFGETRVFFVMSVQIATQVVVGVWRRICLGSQIVGKMIKYYGECGKRS